MSKKKQRWEKQIEKIMETSEDKIPERQIKSFFHYYNKFDVAPPEEWLDIFSAFFETNLEEVPAFDACILAFRAGQVFERFKEQLIDKAS